MDLLRVSVGLATVLIFLASQSYGDGSAAVTREVSLHEAAVAGDEQTVKMLLEAAVGNIDAQNEKGATALHLAVTNGHWEVVELLLAAGADVNKRDEYGRTALHRVALLGLDVEVRQVLAVRLLRAGADINARAESGGTPLHSASGQEFAGELIAVLLTNGADVNARDKNGWVPLHYTASNDRFENALLLLVGGADVNATGVDVKRIGIYEAWEWEDREDEEITGWSVLHQAAYWDSGGVFSLLLTHGADIDAETADGRSVEDLLDWLDSTEVEYVLSDWQEWLERMLSCYQC